ncbi:MAG: Transketolase domain-containing protein [Candidatus Woesebacteria bacterium GW2011_GWA1_39_21b]|uniref:Transketolase domain-containing protein n=2 Tax=Candidatus Woeseibacteriota TaxID=1752722 RepID=A0A0G0NMI4_9BACT|nr:MAG: Transketolase domain-containing protein [Microgenomates group bacterium GW2011_GWC1_38_12]KKR14031.1 MAG: Transketolase domain-containing protein [Candidatus Woesebacteria bacterium GW2011_GWA1_39_21b]OGM65667.1 MAG: hypothetical protein A3A52_02140 [Candidatus Woesebacteria bacterium RIFCSPLOWO2_01_FULL_39_14]
MKINSLTKEQKETRKRILEMSFKRGLSHIGSCLSCVDLIHAIYKVKEKDEKFVLSNGHAGFAYYAILEKFGYLKKNKAEKLHVHPDRNLKNGIDVSTGSLGQGLPIAVGIALANRSQNAYCTISDGECTEGSIWEALRIASENRLDNLKIVLNANGWGAYSEVGLNVLRKRLEAFGCKVISVNGHDLSALQKALKSKSKGKPLLLFAKTLVDQLPFLKGQDAHYYIMKDEDFKLAQKLYS